MLSTGMHGSREGEDLLWLSVQHETCQINNCAFSGRDTFSLTYFSKYPGDLSVMVPEVWVI